MAVQRRGDIGSPRASGDTRSSSSKSRFGSLSISRLRPPPSLRTRGEASKTPVVISLDPAITVLRLIAAVRATALTPPRPSIRAHAPDSTRRCRSSNNGITTEKNSVSCSSPTSTRQGYIARVILAWTLCPASVLAHLHKDIQSLRTGDDRRSREHSRHRRRRPPGGLHGRQQTLANSCSCAWCAGSHRIGPPSSNEKHHAINHCTSAAGSIHRSCCRSDYRYPGITEGRMGCPSTAQSDCQSQSYGSHTTASNEFLKLRR